MLSEHTIIIMFETLLFDCFSAFCRFLSYNDVRICCQSSACHKLSVTRAQDVTHLLECNHLDDVFILVLGLRRQYKVRY